MSYRKPVHFPHPREWLGGGIRRGRDLWAMRRVKTLTGVPSDSSNLGLGGGDGVGREFRDTQVG